MPTTSWLLRPHYKCYYVSRYDLAQFEWIQIQRMLTFRSGGIAIFVYLMSLMLTLVTTRLDDKISLYHINATLFEQSDPKVTYLCNNHILLKLLFFEFFSLGRFSWFGFLG